MCTHEQSPATCELMRWRTVVWKHTPADKSTFRLIKRTNWKNSNEKFIFERIPTDPSGPISKNPFIYFFYIHLEKFLKKNIFFSYFAEKYFVTDRINVVTSGSSYEPKYATRAGQWPPKCEWGNEAIPRQTWKCGKTRTRVSTSRGTDLSSASVIDKEPRWIPNSPLATDKDAYKYRRSKRRRKKKKYHGRHQEARTISPRGDVSRVANSKRIRYLSHSRSR